MLGMQVCAQLCPLTMHTSARWCARDVWYLMKACTGAAVIHAVLIRFF